MDFYYAEFGDKLGMNQKAQKQRKVHRVQKNLLSQDRLSTKLDCRFHYWNHKKKKERNLENIDGEEKKLSFKARAYGQNTEIYHYYQLL